MPAKTFAPRTLPATTPSTEYTTKQIEAILEKALLSHDKFRSRDGELLTSEILNAADRGDPELIGLIARDPILRRWFCQEIDVVTVFQRDAFKAFFSSMIHGNLEYGYSSYGNKIGLTIDGRYLADRGEVALAWKYKDCVLEAGMTKDDTKRRERLYHEVIHRNEIDRLYEAKALVNGHRHTRDGKMPVGELRRHPDGTIAENLVIKGNNLIALHSLKKEFAGKVKLIYIDPPYNTGNDSFAYNDKFNHSMWLTFMKNRLEVARELLREDGVIFVQCDDNEQAYLKVLMDGIFGRESFLNCIAVKMSESSWVKMTHAKMRFPKIKEYLLVYNNNRFEWFEEIDMVKINIWDKENNMFLENFTKEQRDKLIQFENKEEVDPIDLETIIGIFKEVQIKSLESKVKEMNFKNIDDAIEWKFENAYRIIKTAWSSSLLNVVKNLNYIPNQDIACTTSKEWILFYYITKFNRDTKQPRLQVIFSDTGLYKNPCDFWQDIKTTWAISDEWGIQLAYGKKPERLAMRIIKMLTKPWDLVLDFFAGSGTTGAVAHKMGRQYIMVEQMDYIEDLPEARLQKVIEGEQGGISEAVWWKGGGDFVYCELAEDNQRALSAIERSETIDELLTVYGDMIKRRDLWSLDADDIIRELSMEDFRAKDIEWRKDQLRRLLDPNRLYVPASEHLDARYGFSDEDKRLTEEFYGMPPIRR